MATHMGNPVKARMGNPVVIVPEAGLAMHRLRKAIQGGGVPLQTLELVRLRASQINGCGISVEAHTAELRKAGASDERVIAVAAWRDTPYFTEAERAALALGEVVTRLSDRMDPVPDDVWEEAARHFHEAELAILLLAIAGSNFFNRLLTATKQWPPL
jgi:AhpD family alkylhydroperoxidase